MMRKLLLFFALTVFGLNVNAQVITITPMDSVSVEEVVELNNDDVELYAYVTNDSTDTLTIKWRVISNNSPTAWEVSFCDNINCLDVATTNQSTFTLAPDSTSILKMAYLPFLESGESLIEMNISVEGLSGSTQTVKYFAKVTADPTGISSLNVDALSIFPNPTTNFIQVKGIENASDVNAVEIYSIIGKKVMHNEISSLNDLKVNVQGLENGVYLVKLFDNKQSVFYTKTFVKK